MSADCEQGRLFGLSGTDAMSKGKIVVKDCICDAFLQNTLLMPEDYSVIATLNLNGDYVSDQLAAMVGGIGIAPGANINYKTGHAITDWTNVDEIDTYLTRMLNKEAYDRSGLIYGIGHAVYTISDPRAVLLKELAGELVAEKGSEKEFAFLELLEQRAIECFKRVKGTKKQVCPKKFIPRCSPWPVLWDGRRTALRS